MSKVRKISLIAIVFMEIFSVSGFIVLQESVNLTSITLIIGIIVYFITCKSEKTEGNGAGLEWAKGLFMKFELFETLRLYGMMHPDKFEALTEKEFWTMVNEKKRRDEYGNSCNDGMYRWSADDLCV